MNKLLIMYMKNGYSITCQDGTEMEFIDGDESSGIKDLKKAIKICVDHGYEFEVV